MTHCKLNVLNQCNSPEVLRNKNKFKKKKDKLNNADLFYKQYIQFV